MTSSSSSSRARLEQVQQHVIGAEMTSNGGGGGGGGGGRLNGKVAIITGAGSGIGRASALLFSREGAKIFCADWNEDSCLETVRLIKEQNNSASAIGAQADSGSEADNSRIVQQCVKEFGRLDVFFANAGVSGSPLALNQVTAEDFENTFRTNVIGVFLGIKHSCEEMIKVGGGSIICTASVAGLRSGAGGIDYSASKAAVISMVQTSANQLAGTNVRVNALLPGLTETGMTQPMFDHARSRGSQSKIGQLNPLRRAAAPEEMASVALFLACSDSSYVNGQCITACGGLSSSHPTKIGSLDVPLVRPLPTK